MSKAKDKGRFGENQVCEFLMDGTDIIAKRVPLSGSLQGEFCDDVDIIFPGGEKKKAEVKLRKSVSKSLYKWLKIKENSGLKVKYIDETHPDYLILRRDRSPWLVCLSLDEFKKLIIKKD